MNTQTKQRGRPKKQLTPVYHIQNWRIQRMFEVIASPEQMDTFYNHLEACNTGLATDYASKIVEAYFWAQLSTSTGQDYTQAASIPKPK